MHDLPNSIRNGEVTKASDPIVDDEPCRRQNGGSLEDVANPSEEGRPSDQRRENRFSNVVDRAHIGFRGKTVLASVVNVSGSGVMIEAPIQPDIGESLTLEFEGFNRISAVVRWVRKGRIGLDVGDGTIQISNRPPIGDYGRRGRRPRRQAGPA